MCEQNLAGLAGGLQTALEGGFACTGNSAWRSLGGQRQHEAAQPWARAVGSRASCCRGSPGRRRLQAPPGGARLSPGVLGLPALLIHAPGLPSDVLEEIRAWKTEISSWLWEKGPQGSVFRAPQGSPGGSAIEKKRFPSFIYLPVWKTLFEPWQSHWVSSSGPWDVLELWAGWTRAKRRAALQGCALH